MNHHNGTTPWRVPKSEHKRARTHSNRRPSRDPVMSPRLLVFVVLLALGVSGTLLACTSKPEAAEAAAPVTAISSADGDGSTVVVYKSPTCGCCSDWIAHMEKSGFTVEVHDIADVGPVKREMGIGQSLWSCHTAKVGDYVLEGHVPADQVVRMLAEKPAIRGLAVPGMPIGSPGMDEGYDPSTWQDYDVVAFDAQGGTSVYAHIKAPGK